MLRVSNQFRQDKEVNRCDKHQAELEAAISAGRRSEYHRYFRHTVSDPGQEKGRV
jgi:hypothetical protein